MAAQCIRGVHHDVISDSAQLRHVAGRAGRRGAIAARHSVRLARRPGLEPLEERLTPTGNIAITSVSVVDQNDQPLTYDQRRRMGLHPGRLHHPELAEQCLVPRRFHGQWPHPGHRLPHLGRRRLGDGRLVRSIGATFIAYARHEPGHGHRRSGPLGAGDDLRRQHHELHLQRGRRPRWEALSYTVGADARGLRDQQHSRLRLRRGRRFRADDRPRSKPATSRRILTDLDGFDQAMSLTTNSTPTLYQQYGPASSFVTVYNQYWHEHHRRYRRQRQ